MSARPGPGSPLHRRLETLGAARDPSWIGRDPISLVRGRSGRDDLEVAGAVAAGLAFGAVPAILASVRAALEPLGPRPAAGLDALSDGDLRLAYAGFRHRWLGGDDLAAFLGALRRVRAEAGSLEDAFSAGDPGGTTVEGALTALAARLRAADPGFGARGARGFFAGPDSGSACKRPCLFLRWMARDDGVDTGAWTRTSPARLVLPLDTHLARITRSWGLLRRRSDDWKAALEATASLRRFDPGDPVRYDFALCHLGMRGGPLASSVTSPAREASAARSPGRPPSRGRARRRGAPSRRSSPPRPRGTRRS
jgi:uncharacterized protein (TIGR02757 family)